MPRAVSEGRGLAPQGAQIARADVVAKVTDGVFHTFNNILAVVLGRVELMLGQVDAGRLKAAELRNGLLSVQKVTQDAADLLERVQELAQPPADEPERTVDLNTAVGEAIAFVRPHLALDRAPGAALRLACRVTSAPVLVRARASALRELLVTLLVDVTDATPGGGEITVETATAEGGAILHVGGVGAADAGPPDLLATRDLVARYGGRISVRREADGASTVSLTPPGAMTVTRARRAVDAAVPPGLAVLVVEDEPALRSLLRDFLESQGCRVSVAASGSDALAELATSEWEVVLSDLLLPGASGLDIAQAVKSRSPRTGVVLLSGKLLPEDLCADGETVDVALAKPVDLGKLGSVIATLGRRSRE
jgi:hypothetical protein